MSRTYQTEGIILKTMAMGEADRLLTILSPDYGLIKAIAPGSRKPKSKLGGRTALFVVNQLMLLKGRSLDKLLQADVQESFPGLSKDLAKLTTAQYWAELSLCQGMSQTPEFHLYQLMIALLKRLETCLTDDILYLLLEGIGQLLHQAGVTPQLQYCGQSQTPIDPIHLESGQGVYFSYEAGGTVLGEMLAQGSPLEKGRLEETKTHYTRTYTGSNQRTFRNNRYSSLHTHRLTLPQWVILSAVSPDSDFEPLHNPRDYGTQQWLSVEKILRGYVQHHFDRSIRSATLIESVFAPK